MKEERKLKRFSSSEDNTIYSISKRKVRNAVCKAKEKWINDKYTNYVMKEERKLKRFSSSEDNTIYSISKRKVRNAVCKAKEKWINDKYTEIENNLNKNNTRQVDSAVQSLTKSWQPRLKVIEGKQI